MDKTAIRNFAIEARKILMKSAITEAGFYGITKDGCKSPTQKGNDFEVYETVAGTENRIFGDDIKRRASLVKAIGDIGFDQVIEETAYTWFNRIIAIRFMEVNNYLPTRVRVLSSETGSGTPDIISQSDTVELNLSSEELERIQTAKRENRYDDAFRILFIKQCNELNDILPGLFEKTDDYMELLLKITYTNDGVIRMLVDSIPESNFNVETEGQVEIIGWMYQYYNTELKDDTFAKLKKNVKITKERIPAATQLFTPDWIVRYMVENSLGRVWIEHLRAVDPSVDEKEKAEEFGWKYYLPEAEQEEDVVAQLVENRKSYKDLIPQDITCIDPCMGSGHILVYMFDVLMDIYRSEGFSEREAVFDILEKNIRGLDIDRRAYQLSYFALMMKARGCNRIFFRGHEDIDGNRVQVVPRVYAIEESNSIGRDQLQYYGAGLDEMQRGKAIGQMDGLLKTLLDAKEYGAILNVEDCDWSLLRLFVDKCDSVGQISFGGYEAVYAQRTLKRLVDIGETLGRKYDAVVTNPPYMGIKNGNNTIVKYLKSHYTDSKADLSTVFMERSLSMLKPYGFYSMINIPVWMFTSSFEELRRKIVLGNVIVNMLHFGRGVFGADFGTVAFTIKKKSIHKYCGSYKRLFEKQGAVDSVEQKERWFFEKSTIFSTQDRYGRIPGFPIAYWTGESFEGVFNKSIKLADISFPKQGLHTGDNEAYLRFWQEVDYNQIFLDEREKWDNHYTWAKLNKGGDYRKWYGNRQYVILWKDDGKEIKENGHSVGANNKAFFRNIIGFTDITSYKPSFRHYGKGYIFDVAGPSIPNDETIFSDTFLLALLNCKVTEEAMQILSPTIHLNQTALSKMSMEKFKESNIIEGMAERCVEISRKDWDSFETSWNFETHPFLKIDRSYLDGAYAFANTANYYGEENEPSCPVEACYMLWEKECEGRFKELKENEEAINRIFIDIYGLQGELSPEVDDRDITIRKAELQREIKGLISYAVGCMFGRYSLDENGLIYAGGEFEKEKYIAFPVDEDAIIPITDEKYFDDDIVGRFEEFIKTAFGRETLESNLEYIAEALGTKGNSPREKLRMYFLYDFYKDHCNTYSVTGSGKRPIYWLFDSGKQNGFKCLIYLHRYTPDTVGLIRSDYLTKTQSMIENALKNAEYAINTSGSAVDRAQATKKRDKYIKQLAEIRAYYPALSHIALQRINLDLDDGVKANYEKFQNIEVSIEGEKKQKVDLLAKI